jgi:hypothetical protein
MCPLSLLCNMHGSISPVTFWVGVKHNFRMSMLERVDRQDHTVVRGVVYRFCWLHGAGTRLSKKSRSAEYSVLAIMQNVRSRTWIETYYVVIGGGEISPRRP